MKNYLLSSIVAVMALTFLNPIWAEDNKTASEQFKEAMYLKGVDLEYKDTDDYLYCILKNQSFDFNDGNGEMKVEITVRINQDELNDYVDKGNDFYDFELADGYDKVDGYQFWTVVSSTSEDKLFLYPVLENEEAVSDFLMQEDDFIFASASNHGILYVIDKNKKLHRAILHHFMIIPDEKISSSNGTVNIHEIGDLNNDGWNDYKITYSNGYQQIAFYKRG